MSKGGPAQDDMYGKPEKLYSCKVCGRKFKQETLAIDVIIETKHEKICKKATTSKRKPFDAGKQRAGPGSDITYKQVQEAQKEIKKGGAKPPKTHWREKHEDFINSVRAARKVDIAIKNGSPLPPPPKASVPSDYVKCPHCERNFNQSAADRHIPHCAEKSKANAPLRGPPASKPMRAKAQISYPKPGQKAAKPGANAKSSIPKPEPRNKAAPRGRSPVTTTTRNMSKLNMKK